MKIATIAHNLRVAGGRVVGLNIVSAMPSIAPEHELLFVVPADAGYPELDHLPNVSMLCCPVDGWYSRWRWENRVLDRAIKSFKPDWIWALGNIPVCNPPCRQSLLLHNPHRLYRRLSRQGAGFGQRMIKWLSDRQLDRRALFVDRLYCQTETMRRKSHEVLRFSLERIGLCPNSFSTFIHETDRWPESLESLRGRFILFVLTKYYIHKNLERIVEMFEESRKELEDVVCILPISPDQGPGAARLIGKIARWNLQDQIRCVGGVPQEALGEYFAAADVMFLPTLLESFSGTYLEAMTLGTPIVTSDRDFAREICGNAAEYIDPLSTRSMVDGILRLKNSRARRVELVEAGRKRIKTYLRTWPDILRNVLDQEGISHT